ncbi:MAG: hypothetical protein K0R05_3917 [Anaerocolumna sp.]|nr:hypothetical protein [Anaerocolumna sp.]
MLLRAYIDGYFDRIMELDPDFSSTFWNFGNYVTEYYGVLLNVNWDRILTAYTSTDEDAFDMFYTLLDEYLQKVID